jgi:feruloyl esterase
MTKTRPDASLLCVVAVAAAVLVEAGSNAEDIAPVMECAVIADLAGPRFIVETAEVVLAGPAPNASGELLPEHCHVQGMLDPRIGEGGRDFGIGFDLRMPTEWNRRFAFHGGGGLDGLLVPALGDIFGSVRPSALARGFAVVSTDGGHRSATFLDATFGLDQQARVDYAFGAMDRTVVKAKELVERYYGAAPEYSYSLGCSNGGRQGLMASQRFPGHFDGIVAGDPAFKLSQINMDQVWNVQVAARIAPKDASGRPILSRAFSDADLQLAADRLLARCDDLDGLADGMINDWRTCDFDPGELQCEAEKTDACLTEAQVVALRDLHAGPRTSDGEPLYGAFPYDTGLAGPAWRGMHIGSSDDGEWDAADANLGFDSLRYYALTPPDPDFDPMTFDFDRDVARTRQTWALNDADATYLQTFAGAGKMIVYNGNSDQGMASGALADWYDQVVADTGEHVRDSVRVFFVPGMTHCAGGRATDRFDMLDAIVAWVEEGRAPDRIIAAGDAFPGVSRPLCPHPLVARYESGDPDDAGSFACRE